MCTGIESGNINKNPAKHKIELYLHPLLGSAIPQHLRVQVVRLGWLPLPLLALGPEPPGFGSLEEVELCRWDMSAASQAMT